MGSEEKAFYTLRMMLVTTSLNIYHVKGDRVWCIDTISDFYRNLGLK